MRRTVKNLAKLFVDISLTALLLLAVYVGNYKVPQKGIPVASSMPQKQVAEVEKSEEQVQMTDNGLLKTTVKKDPVDWHTKFAEHFTDTVVKGDLSYSSPNLSIQISKGSYDSGVLDTSENGQHIKYGTKVAYTIADVYVGDITCLQTAFAQDTYGNGYSEKLTDMAMRLGSVLAVNGDSYNNNRHQDNGTIIRNGVIYRDQKTDMETCVLSWDGTMQIYTPEELDTQTLVDTGAYQSWIFGPSLLDGGHCSFMTLQDQVVNHPYKGEHEIPDGIFMME